MEIAQADQRLQMQLDLSAPLGLDRIPHAHDVAVPDKLHFLGDSDAFDDVLPARDVADFEAAQVTLAAREDRLAELVDRELVQMIGAAVEEDDLPDSIERHHPPHRRRSRRAQQPVVPPHVASNDGRSREAPQAVGQQPLQPLTGM